MNDYVTQLLDTAGITLGGTEPWAITVHDQRFFRRVLMQGSLGLGESYMDGWWDCGALDQLFTRVLAAQLQKKVRTESKAQQLLRTHLINMQSKSRARIVGERHYDIGNELFSRMLDKRMVYSCGYWKQATNLDEAQEAKLDLVCRKLHLKPGMRVLDIGCGWGSFAQFAAERYGVEVVGITISKEQAAFAEQYCNTLPIEIRLQDYRDVNEQFDRIASIGMFEHVGPKNYRTYMRVARRCLKPDGLFLLHTIASNASGSGSDKWLNTYIFPNSVIPNAQQITAATEDLLNIQDWHNIGPYYDLTLMAWHHNFVTHWDEIKDQYDDRFYRMWTYYLLCCAGGFRSGHNSVWQIVLSRQGSPLSYESIR